MAGRWLSIRDSRSAQIMAAVAILWTGYKLSKADMRHDEYTMTTTVDPVPWQHR